MPLLTKEEFNLYEKIIGLNQKRTKVVMEDFLKSAYKRVVVDDAFLYAVGDIPIALVSHMDTVFEEEPTKSRTGALIPAQSRKPILYYDHWKEQIACPRGAGFDDKAGIYAIIRIIESGLRPSIILTTDEEIGGIGAKKFVNAVKEPLSDLRYIIQLDRRGTEDCVFYDLDSPAFEKYIESFGFKKNFGSFSDISTICPAWKIAGVNLSIGYFNEHSTDEILDVAAWLDTIKKVTVMLKETDIPYWDYIGYKYTQNYGYGYGYGLPYDDEWYYDYWAMGGGADGKYTVPCKICGNVYDIFDTLPVLNPDGTTGYCCLDCEPKTKLCERCGDIFLPKHSFWKYCKCCSKEMKKFGRKRKDN